MAGIVLLISTLIPAHAQTAPQPDKARLSLKVSGNCEMCKERIETAVDVKGVKTAHWSKKSGELVVNYNPQKISAESLESSLVLAGYDTEHRTATEQKYLALPKCCRYREPIPGDMKP